ncbi:MauE/DoxX family redox-associated membrane protein [Pedobacter heparinus]|uniref:MauE/DoxX family redox-associated membrane protein n=1 Tax=Pedobacter heparinus TaxID=984 RepID=UPI0029309FA2|nr:MauE/DoxX family redox-associated membrane protein [Pedobacter heparinus]
MKHKERLIEVCITLLVILFGYTALSKLLEYDKFIFQMRDSRLALMQAYAPVLAWLLPLIELLIVVALYLPGWRKKGLWAAVILLGVFEVYITGMMLSGLKLGCTCGGVVSGLSWKNHLFFNATFMFIGTVALLGMYNRWPLRGGAGPA